MSQWQQEIGMIHSNSNALMRTVVDNRNEFMRQIALIEDGKLRIFERTLAKPEIKDATARTLTQLRGHVNVLDTLIERIKDGTLFSYCTTLDATRPETWAVDRL
jgi:hypothetical protein